VSNVYWFISPWEKVDENEYTSPSRESLWRRLCISEPELNGSDIWVPYSYITIKRSKCGVGYIGTLPVDLDTDETRTVFVDIEEAKQHQDSLIEREANMSYVILNEHQWANIGKYKSLL
jgi:hypothetical protein